MLIKQGYLWYADDLQTDLSNVHTWVISFRIGVFCIWLYSIQGLKFADADIHRILKFGFGYQTVNDLYPDRILQNFKH